MSVLAVSNFVTCVTTLFKSIIGVASNDTPEQGSNRRLLRRAYFRTDICIILLHVR